MTVALLFASRSGADWQPESCPIARNGAERAPLMRARLYMEVQS